MYTGEFVVQEMRIPADTRVEAVTRDELTGEITKQVDIEFSMKVVSNDGLDVDSPNIYT